jgi:hypothetical protein
MQTMPRNETRSRVADIRKRLHPKAMRAESLAELDKLFREGKPPQPQPDGFLPGELVSMSLTRPTDAFVRWVAGMYMPWLGKKFDREANTGINILRPAARSQMKILWKNYEPTVTDNGELEAFPFTTRIAPGALDPNVDVLKIDYDFDANPKFIIRHILDELVQIDEGYYLGKILYRTRNSWHPIGFFSLRDASA